MNIETIDKVKGCLVGLACGDAVGTTLEFKRKGDFTPLSDMEGGGPFGLEKGQWTDDTSMALCLGHSLLQKKGFSATDQMNRYCNWYQYGYMSSTGECFDIGATVSSALNRYLQTGDPFSGSTSTRSSGNGSLMRLAPIPIFFLQQFQTLFILQGKVPEPLMARTSASKAVNCSATLYFPHLMASKEATF